MASQVEGCTQKNGINKCIKKKGHGIAHLSVHTRIIRLGLLRMVVGCSSARNGVGHALEQRAGLVDLAVHRIPADEDVVNVRSGLDARVAHAVPIRLHEVEPMVADGGVEDGLVREDVREAGDGTSLDRVWERAQPVEHALCRGEVVVCAAVRGDHGREVAAVDLEVAVEQLGEDPVNRGDVDGLDGAIRVDEELENTTHDTTSAKARQK
jgi:hypothetical protein